MYLGFPTTKSNGNFIATRLQFEKSDGKMLANDIYFRNYSLWFVNTEVKLIW